MALTNLIFNCGILSLIALISNLYLKNYFYSIFSALFFIFDTFNIHNRYIYQSHTNSGIFFFLLAVFLFCNKKIISKWRLFFIANILSFSVLSSSHVILMSSIFGILMLFWTLKNCAYRFNQYPIYCLVFFSGGIIWPFYIFIVEYILDFNALGLPSYFAQYLNYKNTVSLLINTYPLSMRQIWALNIWNYGIYQILLIIVVLLLMKFYSLKNSYIKRFNNFHLNKFNLLFITFISTVLITSVYSQPIIRAMVPELVLFEVFLGVLLAYSLHNSHLIIKISTFSIIFIILITNYTMYNLLYASNERFIAIPSLNPSSNVFHVSEKRKITEITDKYFKDGAYMHWKIPSGKLGLHSMSIIDFVHYVENNSNLHEDGYKDLWIRFDPIEIVEQYSIH